MTDPVGHLTILLAPDGARLVDNRRRHPQAVLMGRPIDEAAQLLPRLFAVCGVAHGNAFAQAIAAATGQPLTEQDAAARQRAQHFEVVANHVWRFAVTWTQALGMAPEIAPVKAVRDAQAADDPTAASAALRLLLDDPYGPVGRMQEEARRLSGVPGYPSCYPLLGWPTVDWWRATLAQPGFFDRPRLLDGTVPTVLPCGADVGGHDGPVGLVTALVTAAWESLRRLSGPMDPAPANDLEELGLGIGVAETARGPLIYQVRVEGGRVAEARAISPTDWLAAPNGALDRVLTALPTGTGLQGRAQILTALHDPCVPVRFEEAEEVIPKKELSHA